MRLIEKKLCSKGKAAAKRKFSVYPSAYANMYASAVCSGKVKPGGKKKEKVNEENKPSMLAKMLQKATPAKKGKGDPLGTLRKMKDSLRRKEQRAKNGAKSSVEAYDAFRDRMDRGGF